jgi:hypothetical protein
MKSLASLSSAPRAMPSAVPPGAGGLQSARCARGGPPMNSARTPRPPPKSARCSASNEQVDQKQLSLEVLKLIDRFQLPSRPPPRRLFASEAEAATAARWTANATLSKDSLDELRALLKEKRSPQKPPPPPEPWLACFTRPSAAAAPAVSLSDEGDICAGAQSARRHKSPRASSGRPTGGGARVSLSRVAIPTLECGGSFASSRKPCGQSARTHLPSNTDTPIGSGRLSSRSPISSRGAQGEAGGGSGGRNRHFTSQKINFCSSTIGNASMAAFQPAIPATPRTDALGEPATLMGTAADIADQQMHADEEEAGTAALLTGTSPPSDIFMPRDSDVSMESGPSVEPRMSDGGSSEEGRREDKALQHAPFTSAPPAKVRPWVRHDQVRTRPRTCLGMALKGLMQSCCMVSCLLFVYYIVTAHPMAP